jgi:hypothetical protein
LKEGQFDTAQQNLGLFKNDVIDLSAVARLIEEYRDASSHLAKLTSQLSQMGVG